MAIEEQGDDVSAIIAALAGHSVRLLSPTCTFFYRMPLELLRYSQFLPTVKSSSSDVVHPNDEGFFCSFFHNCGLVPFGGVLET